LDCLVKIVNEKAQLSRLEFRESELEGLLRLAIAKDQNSMGGGYIQTLYFRALFDRPSYRLLRIDFHGEF
jgi:hypothetical protein